MPERLEGELRRELDRFGPQGAIADIVAVWPDAVGPSIAANAWPARVSRDGTLNVATSSSAWAYELGLLEADIRGRLEAALGVAPPKVRFAPGPLPEPASDDPVESEKRRPNVTAQHVQAGEELAATVEDENLRKVVARAAAASLARASDDRSVW